MSMLAMSRRFIVSRGPRRILGETRFQTYGNSIWFVDRQPSRRSSSAFRKLLAHRSDRHKHYDNEPEIHSEPKPKMDLGGNTLPNVWQLYMVSGQTALFDYLRRHFWLIEVIVVRITTMSRRFIVSRSPRWILGETRFQTCGNSIWFLDRQPFSTIFVGISKTTGLSKCSSCAFRR